MSGISKELYQVVEAAVERRVEMELPDAAKLTIRSFLQGIAEKDMEYLNGETIHEDLQALGYEDSEFVVNEIKRRIDKESPSLTIPAPKITEEAKEHWKKIKSMKDELVQERVNGTSIRDLAFKYGVSTGFILNLFKDVKFNDLRKRADRPSISLETRKCHHIAVNSKFK